MYFFGLFLQEKLVHLMALFYLFIYLFFSTRWCCAGGMLLNLLLLLLLIIIITVRIAPCVPLTFSFLPQCFILFYFKNFILHSI